MTITKTRSRALLALATSGTLLAATLVAAAPASAASATISGRVTVPSGAYLDAIAVVAWERTATFDDVTDTASLDSTGSFTLDELEAGTSYQLSVIDYSGKTGAGYYTRDKLVPAAADATLVKAGSTGITIRTRASAPATDIGIVLPADGTYPTWNPAGFYVLEPGNGRITGFVGNASSETREPCARARPRAPCGARSQPSRTARSRAWTCRRPGSSRAWTTRWQQSPCRARRRRTSRTTSTSTAA
ncbi:MAG: carboxypeptidase-like regulatory domain-containing protein [Cellulomonas sp.]|uniref:carboxypeptidase-like regulatory domain-containing protein n=1 Tax=Cellulomonas sp. TaxID=40001 RepID=UPI0025897781|nr:carboxypeptidase-like regulatory domain-containing protein [Cellulomonas sp.]MCR6704200.1 carboxypeptidase-like regulatory domain-containing protein [Cellulomonas sp.]